MARYARRPPSGVSHRRGPWKHGSIPVLGLIGGIGAGKSLVAAALAERGALVLDADSIGHTLLDQRPAREQVLKRFGKSILEAPAAPNSPPRIDRGALGVLVFAQPQALRNLEAILHPRMRRTFERAIARAVRKGQANAVVLDAAVLLEAGWNDLCDTVVFVDAPREQRLARLSAQRGWSDDALAARERMQWPLDEKRRQAGHVLANTGDVESLRAAVDRLWKEVITPNRSLRAATARTDGARRQVHVPRGGPP